MTAVVMSAERLSDLWAVLPLERAKGTGKLRGFDTYRVQLVQNGQPLIDQKGWFTNDQVTLMDQARGWESRTGVPAEELATALQEVFALVDAHLRESTSGESPLTRLQAVVQHHKVRAFRDQQGGLWACIPVGSHREILPLASSKGGDGFAAWLGVRYAEQYRASVPGGDVSTALAQLAEQARGVPPEVVARRSVVHAEALYLDIGNDARTVLRIDTGGWQVVQAGPVHFRRPAAMGALGDPRQGSGGGTVEGLRELLPVLSDADWLLVRAWLVAVLLGQGPVPVLCLTGEPGAGKSTMARVLKLVVDPLVDHWERALLSPRIQEETALKMTHQHSVLVFDDVRSLDTPLGEFLAGLVTGTAFERNKLYSENETVTLSGRAAVILTSVGDVVSRSDIARRSLTIGLGSRPQNGYAPEALGAGAFRRQVEDALPGVMEGLCGVIAKTLAALPLLPGSVQAQLKTISMNDFATIGCAVAVAGGGTAEEFLAAYQGDQERGLAMLAGQSSVRAVLTAQLYGVARTAPKETPIATLSGTAQVLYQDARGYYYGCFFYTQLPGDFPASAEGFARELALLIPVLRTDGVTLQRGRKGDTRIWTLSAPTDVLLAQPAPTLYVYQDRHKAGGSMWGYPDSDVNES